MLLVPTWCRLRAGLVVGDGGRGRTAPPAVYKRGPKPFLVVDLLFCGPIAYNDYILSQNRGCVPVFVLDVYRVRVNVCKRLLAPPISSGVGRPSTRGGWWLHRHPARGIEGPRRRRPARLGVRSTVSFTDMGFLSRTPASVSQAPGRSNTPVVTTLPYCIQ